MLQCAAAVDQSQKQPHLNRRLHTGGIKTEAETTATRNRLRALLPVILAVAAVAPAVPALLHVYSAVVNGPGWPTSLESIGVPWPSIGKV